VSFESWRVAILNYIDELEPNKITNFQKHDSTDEIFVLLEGGCVLYFGDCINGEITNIEAVNMVKNKIYNVKKGVYHTHTLTVDAKVLIVENEDTSDENSPSIEIDVHVRKKLTELYRKM
jgi:hypothetical protein